MATFFNIPYVRAGVDDQRHVAGMYFVGVPWHTLVTVPGGV